MKPHRLVAILCVAIAALCEACVSLAGAETAAPQGKPSAANTGPRTARLEPLASTKITRPGVYENFTASSQVTVTASNVTLRNFRIRTSSPYGIKVTGSNVLLEDGEISGMASAAVLGSGWTARRLHVFDSGSDGFKPYSDVVIEDCYVHSLGSKPASHADGVQMVRGGNVVIRRNNFEMPHDQPGYKNSQVILVKTDDDKIDNVVIENNWINGGGYSIQVRQTKAFGAPTRVTVRGNRFGRAYQFGPWKIDGDNRLCGNVWQAGGALLPENGRCK